MHDPDVVLIGTGSEVQLAVEAQKLLADKDIVARVVSMPCVDGSSRSRATTATACCRRRCRRGWPSRPGVAQCWHKLVGDTGKIVSIEHYGESADYKTLFREFGFTAKPSRPPRKQ